ncbi:hypothetical protein [Kitasatospora sp. NPDC059571]|uniref:hypothetical protein n=1 Tax=Kitasatospora sp. NPDC059571 TaxID=3346871 RepID=UPI0036B52B59
MSLNQYAGHVYIAKSVVSRALSGERVPDGQFLGTLLTCWGERQHPPVLRADQGFALRLTELTALQRNVLRATHPAQYEEQLAADDRNNAQARLEELEEEVRQYRQGVADREHQLEQVRGELREIAENNARHSGELGKEIELRRKHEVVLLNDLKKMEAELGRVRQELAEALRSRDEALAECERLERELEEAQNAADRERLQENIARFVGEAAEAAQRVEFRRAELEQVTAEAEQVKAEAQQARIEANRLRLEAQQLRANAERRARQTDATSDCL